MNKSPKTTPIGIRFYPSDLLNVATIRQLYPEIRGYGEAVRFALSVTVASLTDQEGGTHE